LCSLFLFPLFSFFSLSVFLSLSLFSCSSVFLGFLVFSFSFGFRWVSSQHHCCNFPVTDSLVTETHYMG
jgi:hypothetical protein